MCFIKYTKSIHPKSLLLLLVVIFKLLQKELLMYNVLFSYWWTIYLNLLSTFVVKRSLLSCLRKFIHHEFPITQQFEWTTLIQSFKLKASIDCHFWNPKLKVVKWCCMPNVLANMKNVPPSRSLKYSNYNNQEHLKQGIIFNILHLKLLKYLKTLIVFTT
jgi:hypothetical protein